MLQLMGKKIFSILRLKIVFIETCAVYNSILDWLSSYLSWSLQLLSRRFVKCKISFNQMVSLQTLDDPDQTPSNASKQYVFSFEVMRRLISIYTIQLTKTDATLFIYQRW